MQRHFVLWSFLFLVSLSGLGSCVRNPGVAPLPDAPQALPGELPEFSTEQEVPFVHPRVWQGLALRSQMSCPLYDGQDYRSVGAWPAPRLTEPDGAHLDVMACTRFDEPDDPGVALAWVVPPRLAHDSGLCLASEMLRQAFAADPDNWVYGPVEVFRSARRGRGPGGWMPTRNGCWYAAAQLRIRQRYGLSLTDADAFVLDRMLASCALVGVEPSCELTPSAAVGRSVPARR